MIEEKKQYGGGDDVSIPGGHRPNAAGVTSLSGPLRHVKIQPHFLHLKSISVQIKQFLTAWPYADGCHDKESILNRGKWL